MILINTISEAQFDAMVSGNIAFFRKVALRILKNWQDADDAVQNALLKGWRRRLFLRRRDRLLQWLCSIVINESYNILRARQNDEKRCSVASENVAMPQTYETTEQLSRLDAAIANLPEIYRKTVHVALLSGMETDTAASLLGCSTNTLYQRIHKAKQLLREALKDE